MDRTKPYLQVAALVSAVVLVGAFVSYRAGAIPFSTKPEPQPEPQPTVAESPAQQSPAPVAPADQSQIFLYSSKSAPVFTPDQAAPVPQSPAPGNPPTFMGGSKSIILIDPATGKPAGSSPTPAPSAPGTPQSFMGSSKWIQIVPTPPVPPKPAPKP